MGDTTFTVGGPRTQGPSPRRPKAKVTAIGYVIVTLVVQRRVVDLWAQKAARQTMQVTGGAPAPDEEATMEKADRPRVVVGFDGSKCSEEALRWAAGEAAARGATLEVVQAVNPRDFDFGSNAEHARTLSASLHREVSAVLGDRAAGLDIKEIVQAGPATKVLVERSAEAEMLVVGSRGHGGFAGLLLGSVRHQVAHHATARAVVVVRS